MNRIKPALLLLTFWLGACASSPDLTATESRDPATGESAPSENSNPASAAREAVVSEFENDVTLRAASEGDFISAEIGSVIGQGGALQTGADSRARLDLNPEGTIVRVAPNSSFSIPEITSSDGEPRTSLSLFFGKIFVLLKGGSLDVQTPSGVASVRGSLLSVGFDPAAGRVQAACLEGQCSLVNEAGDVVELTEGESAYVDENGDVFELDGIDRDEIQEWLDEIPELNEFMDEIPDPAEYQDFEEFQDFESGSFLEDEDSSGGESETGDSEGEEPPPDESGGEGEGDP